MKTIKDYYDEAISIVEACLGHYDYGYSPELQPIVDALRECDNKLHKAKEEL